MSRPSVEGGFKFWREEVEGDQLFDKQVPYIPVIALVGVYAAFNTDRTRLNSYQWRQTVLHSPNALDGLRQSLSSFFRDELDDEYEVSIIEQAPEPQASNQHHHAYDSLINGLPGHVTVVPLNELFLAQTLGFARHDYAVGFNPLRLYDQGPLAFKNHYPKTASFVDEHS
jgi:hypothetical protein